MSSRRFRLQACWSCAGDIDLKSNKIGIYSRPAKLGDTLNDGDRVEIYRPLIADPERAAPATGRKAK